MGGIFGGGRIPQPSAPPPAPTRADPAVEEARRRELMAANKIAGAGANLLTGSALGDTAPVRAGVKTLLGS